MNERRLERSWILIPWPAAELVASRASLGIVAIGQVFLFNRVDLQASPYARQQVANRRHDSPSDSDAIALDQLCSSADVIIVARLE
jgi:hypothetical protein